MRYLLARGLRLVERNYRGRGGEIDLIMRERETLVFIEVRYRRSGRYGSAAETVTSGKQQRLLATAARYLQRHRLDLPCRFDVVGISGAQLEAIEWIRDAFQLH